jgi:hypothetical protein
MPQNATEPEDFMEVIDPSDERREAERYALTFKLSVSVEAPGGGGVTITPATVWNISRSGVLVETREPLPHMQIISIAIPTDQCPEGMRMPQAFIGGAIVARSGRTTQGKCLAGLRFGDSLTQNMEFVMYMEFLQSTALTNWFLMQ